MFVPKLLTPSRIHFIAVQQWVFFCNGKAETFVFKTLSNPKLYPIFGAPENKKTLAKFYHHLEENVSFIGLIINNNNYVALADCLS